LWKRKSIECNSMEWNEMKSTLIVSISFHLTWLDLIWFNLLSSESILLQFVYLSHFQWDLLNCEMNGSSKLTKLN
jgi:hypothetical protein